MKTLLLPALLCLVGCAYSGALSRPDTITVEGIASVRGNVPFTVVMLQTKEENYYILALTDEERRTWDSSLPGRLRVTGELSVESWNGRPFAHLRPTSIERL